MQVPLQAICPDAHAVTHTPPLQACEAPHVMPHPPQFALSVCSFAQYAVPPSGERPASSPHKAKPLPHVALQAPFEQTRPAPHVMPHPPQFALSVCSFAQ